MADNLLQGGYPFSGSGLVSGTGADIARQSGIITIQLLHYFSSFHAHRSPGCPPRPRDVFVFVLGLLSFAKSGQCVAIIWEHNITYKLDLEQVQDMGLYNYLELLTPFTVRERP